MSGLTNMQTPFDPPAAIEVAVARSFVHRFLAKAFEDPNPKAWWWLTHTVMENVLGAAVQRLAAEGAFSLEESARQLLPHFKKENFGAFQADYLAAFGHTVRGDCPMNEIEYGDIKADPLFQPHRLADLGAFYLAFGLEVSDDAAERHDHICLELEFMSVLAAKEGFALQQHLPEEHWEVCLQAEKKFLRDHLGRWTPAFTRRLARAVGEGALGALANFTRAFIEAECRRFGITPGSEDLLLRPVDESAESLCTSCGLNSLPPGALAVRET